MAIITNVNVHLSSFKVNDVTSNLVNNAGTYGTYDILNGGELLENTLAYTFTVTGLLNHQIASIVINSLLLTNSGELNGPRTLTMAIDNYGSSYSGNINANASRKVIIPTAFTETMQQDSNEFSFTYKVQMSSGLSCFYGLQGIIINLADIPYSISITFSGPMTGRNPSTITASTLILSRGTTAVSFSKNSLENYDVENDSVEGRIYFKKDGIFIDNYQYGTVAPATENKLGLVKLFRTFASDEEGIIAPEETDAAATPQLVYNAVASLKEYTDELVGGVLAPDLYIEEQATIEDDETHEKEVVTQNRQLTGDVILSDDFEATEENKIKIKWLEII